MKVPKKWEKGFTLIELLIVVAILGVLAAVVIPNVGRFIGRGETEAAAAELKNIQAAVMAMMTDNGLQTLPTPRSGSGNATKDMFNFPDTTIAANKIDPSTGTNMSSGNNAGWVLYQCDRDGSDGNNSTLVNYVAARYTKGTYYVDQFGTVTQNSTGY